MDEVLGQLQFETMEYDPLQVAGQMVLELELELELSSGDSGEEHVLPDVSFIVE